MKYDCNMGMMMSVHFFQKRESNIKPENIKLVILIIFQGTTDFNMKSVYEKNCLKIFKDFSIYPLA